MLQSLSAFLKAAPFLVFLFAAGLPLLIASAAFAAATWSKRNAGSPAGQVAVGPAEPSAGHRLVQGWLATSGGRTAPLTGRACAWYTARVGESVRIDKHARNAKTTWRAIFDETSGKKFFLHDGDARVAIDPGGATALATDCSDWRGTAPRPEDRDPARFPGSRAPTGSFERPGSGRFRYRESYVYDGDPVFVLGLTREGRNGGMTIAAPDDKRPFLISTRSPADILAESRLAVQGGLIGAAFFGALGLAVIWLRFS